MALCSEYRTCVECKNNKEIQKNTLFNKYFLEPEKWFKMQPLNSGRVESLKRRSVNY